MSSKDYIGSSIGRGQSPVQGRKKMARLTRGPLPLFIIALLTSAVILVLIALAIGRSGLGMPIAPGVEGAAGMNLQLWSLVIASVVAVAGSITAVFIAHSAYRAQQDALKLQHLEALHSHPDYKRALGIERAALKMSAVLQLLVMGLRDSQSYAQLTARANAVPMINKWSSFSSSLHDVIVESDLYTYLLSAQTRNADIVPWSVSSLLSTATDLGAIVAVAGGTSAQNGSEQGDAPELAQLQREADRRLFSRNALALIAASILLDRVSRLPDAMGIFNVLTKDDMGTLLSGGASSGVSRSESSWAAPGSLKLITGQLIDEMLARASKTNIPVVPVERVAQTVARTLRTHFDEYDPEPARERRGRPYVLVDYDVPFAREALVVACDRALAVDPRKFAEGRDVPGVAAEVVHIERIVDFAKYCDLGDDLSARGLQTLGDLLPPDGSALDTYVRAKLDRLLTKIAAVARDSLFVLHLLSVKDQAAMAYLAGQLGKAVLVWHGWPFLPNENVAFKTLIDDRQFTRAAFDSDRISVDVPLVFLGTLSDTIEPISDPNSNAQKLRTRCSYMIVSDLI